MFSPELKEEISDAVHRILKQTNHGELPKGEISFLLHVDGAQSWSWANIRNSSARDIPAPRTLVRNETE